MSEKITIAVVDDHPLMRNGIVSTLSEAGFDVVATGGSADDAIRIADEHQPRMMLLDLSMPGGGLDAAKVICAIHPAMKVMILTVSEREDDVIAAMSTGVCGYILKGISGGDLVATLKAVNHGETYITPNLAARLISKSHTAISRSTSKSADVQLTVREEQILLEVKAGHTNKEIARKLALSEKTVKHYMTSVLQKLRARNRVEAAMTDLPKRD
ncbi:MAG: response regulator transcription factor [Hyphomicrobium sp.]|nr:response regulator transcription factor [Hyphomicrobium sp.]